MLFETLQKLKGYEHRNIIVSNSREGKTLEIVTEIRDCRIEQFLVVSKKGKDKRNFQSHELKAAVAHFEKI